MNGNTDTAVKLILQKMPLLQGNWLIIADENWYSVDWSAVCNARGKSPQVVSNRFDIAQAAQTAGLKSAFNDFDFSHYPKRSLDGLLYRVSKERASNHHMINCAQRLLKAGAILILSGQKNDGIKTYVKQASQLFGNPVNADKKGSAYSATIQLNELDGDPLDDKNYAQLRPLKTDSKLPLQSKPGIFGWNKIDRGSQFLVNYLPEFLAGFKKAPQSLLDLGCGYGYLSLQAIEQGFERIVATDNNAAALMATSKNLSSNNKIDWDVVAADAGDQIHETFDAILCNPPFHSGFAVDSDLSIKFLSNSKRLLRESGKAFFVVNSFIALEQIATQYFDNVDVVASNGSFKLVVLSH